MNRRELLLMGASAGAATLLPSAGFTAPRLSYVYLSEVGTPNRIRAYGLDTTGSLTPVPGSPFGTNSGGATCSGQCQVLSFLPGLNLLLATGDQGISVFRVAADGTLTLVNGSPFGAGRPVGVTAVSAGTRVFVYTADYDADAVLGFELGPDGTVTALPVSQVTTGVGSGPSGIASSGNVLAVSLFRGSGVATFQVRSDGKLAPALGTPVSLLNSSPYNVNFDPTGRYVYLAGFNTASIFGFRLDRTTAVLTPLPGSPFSTNATDTYDSGLCLGKPPLVLAPSSGGNLQAFHRRGNGRLAPLGLEQSTGLTSVGCAGLDPSGKLLVVAGRDAQTIATFSVNPHSGRLTPRTTRTEAFSDLDGMAFAQI